ncbi:MAG: hypothetical protein ACLFNK_04410 [Candidatus Woesearchaeota archaeon]
MEKIIYVLGMFVLAVSLSACGSVDAPEQDTQPDASDDLEDTESTEEPEESEIDDGAYDEFQDKLQDNPEYMVDYDLTRASGQAENIVIYTSEDKIRMDVNSGNDEFILWEADSDVLEYEGQCLDLGAAKNLGFDPEDLLNITTVEGTIEAEDKYLDVSPAGTQEIAGRTTECFEFVYETETYSELTTVCLTDKGLPALIEVVDTEADELISEVRANEFDDSVSDDVLEPCEPDMDVSGLM